MSMAESRWWVCGCSLYRQNQQDDREEFPIQAVGTGGLTEEMSHICKKRVQRFPGRINEKMYALWPVTHDHITGGNLRKSLPCPGDSQQPSPVFSPQPENLGVFWDSVVSFLTSPQRLKILLNSLNHPSAIHGFVWAVLKPHYSHNSLLDEVGQLPRVKGRRRSKVQECTSTCPPVMLCTILWIHFILCLWGIH